MTSVMFQALEKFSAAFENCFGSKTGIAYMLTQAFLLSVINCLAKYLHRIPSFGITYYRAIVMYLLQLLYVEKYKIEVFPRNSKLHTAMIWRGLLGFIGLGSFFYSVKLIPLMEASTLFNLSPVMIALGASLTLGESFGKLEAASLVLSFSGFVFIVKPPFLFSRDAAINIDYGNHLKGVIGALVTAFSMTIVTLIIRKFKADIHPMIPNQIFAGANAIFSPIALITFQRTVFPSLNEFFILILIGLLSAVALLMRTRALHLEKAGKVSIINYTGILFGYLFDVLLFNENIGLLSILGSCLITSGALIVFLMKGEDVHLLKGKF